VWRWLAASFLLANKLLDRESLQNQMWSEITGISLSEPNALETARLDSVDGDLGFDAVSRDFKAFLHRWVYWSGVEEIVFESSCRLTF
jgi:hypothetical protein